MIVLVVVIVVVVVAVIVVIVVIVMIDVVTIEVHGGHLDTLCGISWRSVGPRGDGSF